MNSELRLDTYHFWVGCALVFWSIAEAYRRKTLDFVSFMYTVNASDSPWLFMLMLFAKFALGAWLISQAYIYYY